MYIFIKLFDNLPLPSFGIQFPNRAAFNNPLCGALLTGDDEHDDLGRRPAPAHIPEVKVPNVFRYMTCQEFMQNLSRNSARQTNLLKLRLISLGFKLFRYLSNRDSIHKAAYSRLNLSDSQQQL